MAEMTEVPDQATRVNTRVRLVDLDPRANAGAATGAHECEAAIFEGAHSRHLGSVRVEDDERNGVGTCDRVARLVDAFDGAGWPEQKVPEEIASAERIGRSHA